MPRMRAHESHEVRLIRTRFAREVEYRAGNGTLDFGTPLDGWVWLVERIAVKAAAAATVEVFVGGGYAATINEAEPSKTRGFAPEILVPERSPLALVVSGLAGTEAVEANVQLTIARKTSQRVDTPEEMLAILAQIRDGFLVTADE